MRKGTFIALEGGEGAGKTTIANALKGTLSPEQFLVTRAGGSPFGEKLRALFVSDEAGRTSPESRFALAFAAQADHVAEVVAPALKKGIHVISDRLDASILAYQVHGENRLDLAPLFWKTREVLFQQVLPDLYLFLDVSTEQGFARVKREGRTLDHFEKRSLNFHERVRKGYTEFFKTVPHVIVDANRPLEAVQADTLSIIQNILKPKTKQ
jgi:dTMP kinase